MTSAPQASVVICAYTADRWALLQGAIESAASQVPPPTELLVVIDHNDALAARLREAHPSLRILANTNMTGLSGARNAGLAAATGDFVVFLDDDAAARPGWLAELLEAFDERDVQGVGGGIQPRWLAGRPRWFPEEFNWVVGCSYRGQPGEPADVRNPIGANMAFRSSLFRSIGGFRSGLGRVGTTPVGGEETELCIRASMADPATRFVLRPAAAVDHTVPRSRASFRYFVRRCFAEGASKAVIARAVGRGAGLASERGYATRTLPTGVALAVRDALKGDLWGVARAGAIVTGLSVTVAGYVVGALTPVGDPAPPAPET